MLVQFPLHQATCILGGIDVRNYPAGAESAKGGVEKGIQSATYPIVLTDNSAPQRAL
jgi:hypothetical protein